MNLVEKALRFATEAHEGQVRKYTGEPYINHPMAVAELVSGVPHTEEMLAAALLHDTVEDCEVSPEDIMELFGKDVHDMVLMLTDVTKLYNMKGNRKYRKTIDRAHSSTASADAKTIKIADLLHNSESILKHDESFAKVFLKEKRLLLGVLTEGNEDLYSRAIAVTETYGY